MIKLSTFDEVADYLGKILRGEVPKEQIEEGVEFGEEIKRLRIHLEGKNFHASVTGNLSRGLWELQQEFYRAAARTTHGVANIKKLSKAELDAYNLVFEVEEGSSDLIAGLLNFLNGLTEGIQGMSDTHQLIFLLGFVLIVAGGLGLTMVKMKDIEANKDLGLEQEKTKQLDVVRAAAQQVPALGRWSEAAESGSRSVAKGGSDANHILIGTESVDRDEIAEINKRAPRTVAGVEIIEDEFRIITVKESSDQIRNLLLSKEGLELTAILDESRFDEQQLDRLFLAFRHRMPISLEVNAKATADGYKGAYITAIPDIAEQ